MNNFNNDYKRGKIVAECKFKINRKNKFNLSMLK